MARPKTSRKKAYVLSISLFLLGVILTALLQSFWPLILLAFGFPLATFQYLSGKIYEPLLTLFIFLGGYLTVEFNWQEHFFLPTLFCLGAFYILIRELMTPEPITEEEKEEELEKEIEEHKK
jgi:predicted membrane protein